MLRNILRLVTLVVASVANFVSFAGAQEGLSRTPNGVVAANWGGFYVGAHAGYGRSSDPHLSQMDTMLLGAGIGPSFLRSVSINDRDGGAIGGLQIGYNWQFTPNWLAGIEGDWSWTGLRPGGNVGPLILWNGPTAAGTSVTMHTDIRSIGSVRGRLGYTQPAWMGYVTGGYARANLDFSGDSQCPLGICPEDVHGPVNFSRARSGWVLGGGVEFKRAANPWSLGVEYLYYRFSGEDRASSEAISNVTGATTTAIGGCLAGTQCYHYTFGDIALQTARLRLNYRFD